MLTFGGKFNNSSRKWQFLSTTLIFRRFFSKINLHRFFCCRYLRDFFVLLHNYLRLVRVTRRAFLKHSFFFDVCFHPVVQHAIYRCKIDNCFGSLCTFIVFFQIADVLCKPRHESPCRKGGPSRSRAYPFGANWHRHNTPLWRTVRKTRLQTQTLWIYLRQTLWAFDRFATIFVCFPELGFHNV